MTNYQSKTLKKIRSTSSLLIPFSDEWLIQLYHEWSEETACAGWLDSTQGVEEFCTWAVTPPCERKRNE